MGKKTIKKPYYINVVKTYICLIQFYSKMSTKVNKIGQTHERIVKNAEKTVHNILNLIFKI